MYGIYDLTDGLLAAFVAPLTVKSNQPIFSADTLSLHRKVSRRTAQRWEIETNLMPLTLTANDLFVNFVVNGHSEPMYVLIPQNMGVIKRRTSTAIVSATGAVGASVVGISGHNGLVPKGTFIKFANHDKVYMTTTDAVALDSTVGIYPTLRTTLTGGQTMSYLDDVIMKGLYDIDVISGMVFTDGILMDNGTIKIIEKLQ
jgi:hypothetical protein